jgi:hypothetical protein
MISEKTAASSLAMGTMRAFTAANVEALPAGRVGCYALYAGEECIFVGGGDIRARLLAHLQGDNFCIMIHRPTHWVHLITPYVDAEGLRLVVALKPRCNHRVA